MPRKARPKRQRAKTQIKAWRKHRTLTLAKLSERLEYECDLVISDGQLSRIERGEQPYTQDLLEALGKVLRCEPTDLIDQPPDKSAHTEDDFRDATPAEKLQARAFIETIRRTGTRS